MSTTEATTTDPLRTLLLRYQEHADEEAMEELVARTRPRLLRTALRIGGAADAEDAVQAAYYSLLRQTEAPRTSVEAWLTTAVVRIAFRRKARAQRQLDLAARLSERARPLDTADAPPEAALRAEERSQLLGAVHRLPDHYREAIVLHYLQGLTARETAALLDISESTVRTRLQRGRAMLQGHLPAHMLRVWLVATGACLAGLRSARAAVPGGAIPPLAGSAVVALCVASAFLPWLWQDPTSDVPYRRQLQRESSLPAVHENEPVEVADAEPAPAPSTPRPHATRPIVAPRPAPVDPPEPHRQPGERLEPTAPPSRAARETVPPPPVDPLPPVVTTVLRPTPPLAPRLLEHPAFGPSRSELKDLPRAGLSSLHSALEKNPGEGLLQLLDAADQHWTNVAGFRARLAKEERIAGKRQPREEIAVLFHKPYCAVMDWTDATNDGKRVLYVSGKYDSRLSIKAKFLFWIHVTREIDDPSVMENTNRRIDELSFGATLAALREKAEAGWSVRYLGRKKIQSDRTKTLAVALDLGVERHEVHFDSETLMPVRTEIVDGDGLVGLYEVRDVVLNPVDRSGRPLLDAATFHRSAVFPGQWEVPDSESWTWKELPDGRWTF